MAILQISTPPKSDNAHYPDYKDWLLHNYFDHLCSYCLLKHTNLEVDHYEPQGYAPEREHDPTNLLLSCRNCNRSKWDYHPNHAQRRSRRSDKHGFLILDTRVEDLADLFELKETGEIFAKAGGNQERAAWNALVFKLDLDVSVKTRQRLLEKLSVCEKLLVRKRDEDLEECLGMLLKDCSESYLLFKALDIKMTEDLRSLLEERFEHDRGVLLT
jgi:hypothetical protein